MKNKKIELPSGRKCEIGDMTIDEVDSCSDVTSIIMENGEVKSVSNVSKARTSWIRKGLKGGDFKDFEMKGNIPVDSVLKQLTEDEKNDLSSAIQEHQRLGE
jgi:hypothetical protein